eukprot:TRINITY_DN63255_c0_g1_i1.p1 TRINITY_DN63255_c0_g1~~TRINITY_DN63255_c0_g1_i1.p1  ORF type:complete len:297 (-),score=48.90 TRINITY_DN63255_c0_g1_i1:391-1281(-)
MAVASASMLVVVVPSAFSQLQLGIYRRWFPIITFWLWTMQASCSVPSPPSPGGNQACTIANANNTDATCGVNLTAMEQSAGLMRPLVIAMAGGSGCGKTTMAKRISEMVGPGLEIVTTDAYYHTLSEEDHLLALKGEVNFDRLEAVDMERFAQDLRRIRADNQWPLPLPSYDFLTHQRSDQVSWLKRPRALLIEGLFVLAVPEVRDLVDLKVFVGDDVDTCLLQRLRRDTAERGISIDAGLRQYERHVKPALDAIIAPSAAFADLVVPSGTRNERAASVIAGWITSRTIAVTKAPA